LEQGREKKTEHGPGPLKDGGADERERERERERDRGEGAAIWSQLTVEM
jgi:hypothetical protein